MNLNIKKDRRKPEYGFFGKHYIEGDESEEWYLSWKKQTLEERTKTEVEWVIKLLNLKWWEAILDIPTWYWRHSIELAKLWYEVTWMDINPEHLSIAKEKGSIYQNLKLLEKNMIEIDDVEKYDAIINMFYSFGFFDTDEENITVLKKIYDSLKPWWNFLMHTDVNIPKILDWSYKTHEFRKLLSWNTLEIIDNYNSSTKKIEWNWIIHNKDWSSHKKDYFVRVYTKEEFEEICFKVWFKKVNTFSDWNWSSYSTQSEDMMVVATK